jgi:hypothetical protein
VKSGGRGHRSHTERALSAAQEFHCRRLIRLSLMSAATLDGTVSLWLIDPASTTFTANEIASAWDGGDPGEGDRR